MVLTLSTVSSSPGEPTKYFPVFYFVYHAPILLHHPTFFQIVDICPFGMQDGFKVRELFHLFQSIMFINWYGIKLLICIRMLIVFCMFPCPYFLELLFHYPDPVAHQVSLLEIFLLYRINSCLIMIYSSFHTVKSFSFSLLLLFCLNRNTRTNLDFFKPLNPSVLTL